jgi:hypothetical protein
MSDSLLTVCVLAKDEESSIADALACFSGHPVDLLVGDTGSTDRTASMAERLGARVVSVPWENHFARARNALLAHATGKWVLSLDADERVSHGDVEVLVNALRMGGLDRFQAYEVDRRSYVGSTEPQYRLSLVSGDYPEMEDGHAAYVSEPNILLFRNHKGIEWKGAVHETVLASVDPAGKGEGYSRIPWLVIHNFGRERRREQKMEMYEGMVRTRLAEDPQDHLSWFYDALMKEARGDMPAASSSFRKSKLLKKTPYGHYGLGMCQLRQGEYLQAEIEFVEYLRMSPQDPNAWMALLVCAQGSKNMDKLDYYLGKALAAGSARQEDLIRFALYAARTGGYETKVGLYGKLLEKHAKRPG